MAGRYGENSVRLEAGVGGRNRRQEVGGKRSDAGGQRQEVGGRRLEVGGRRLEVGKGAGNHALDGWPGHVGDPRLMG